MTSPKPGTSTFAPVPNVAESPLKTLTRTARAAAVSLVIAVAAAAITIFGAWTDHRHAGALESGGVLGPARAMEPARRIPNPIPDGGGGGGNSTTTTTTTVPAENCDPSYPAVCIPPAPPDLNCDDIPFTDFVVLQPDPHRFDGDKDGIGCSS